MKYFRWKNVLWVWVSLTSPVRGSNGPTPPPLRRHCNYFDGTAYRKPCRFRKISPPGPPEVFPPGTAYCIRSSLIIAHFCSTGFTLTNHFSLLRWPLTSLYWLFYAIFFFSEANLALTLLSLAQFFWFLGFRVLV